jgi:hypothetical protein
MIRVRAKPGSCVPMTDADGFTLFGRPHRWCGLEADGKTPRIESVPDLAYYHRHIAAGDLELVEETAEPTTRTRTVKGAE